MVILETVSDGCALLGLAAAAGDRSPSGFKAGQRGDVEM